MDARNLVQAICPKKKMSLGMKALIFLTIVLAGFLALTGAAWTYAKVYEGRVYPGVYVGNFHLGGLDEKQIKSLVENFNNRLFKEGIQFDITDVAGRRKTIKFNGMKQEDAAKALVEADSEKLSKEALLLGRGGEWKKNLWEPIYFKFLSNKKFSAEVFWDEEGFTAALKQAFGGLEEETKNAEIKITNSDPANLVYKIIPEVYGGKFSFKEILEEVKKEVSTLSFAPISAVAQKTEPEIKLEDVAAVAESLPDILGAGPILLKYVNPLTGKEKEWKVPVSEFSKWLKPQKDSSGRVVFMLNDNDLKKYLEVTGYEINLPAQDAKFVVENGRVREFQTSHAGAILNAEESFKAINKAFLSRNYGGDLAVRSVALIIDVEDPKIKVTDANNLGISNIVGVGTSTFKDSHNNRIKNIANAVKRLNGMLIKPNQVFSTVESAGPFTKENGFLPEEVIKGDKIAVEIGGGMCQIGTTLFRMAMNSAMPITERRNHSLVVQYYADPVNGNPGTDATVYEPLVDFKFLNDTGNYLLLQTYIDYEKQMLTFTLWGQPDGRAGFYTHPVVTKWIPAGDPKEVEVEDLKPGEKKCQNAFRGAVANFTYTRITPEGEKIERIFDSYYRPLPKICFVPKKPEPTCEETGTCDLQSSIKNIKPALPASSAYRSDMDFINVGL